MVKDESFLTAVSTTYELTHNGYVYRLIKDAMPKGKTRVIVRRLAVDKAGNWSHGVLTQLLDAETMTFKPTCMVTGRQDFDNVVKALTFIESQPES